MLMKFRLVSEKFSKELEEAAVNNYKWHELFAILPKHLEDGRWAWLERVEGRISPYSPLGLTWEYRALNN